MTNLRSYPSRFAVRSLAGLLTLSLFLAAVAGLSVASDPEPKPPAAKTSGQPERPPEEEEPNALPVTNHKVTVPDSDEPASRPAPSPQPMDLTQAARDAKRTPIKILFQRLEVPHDVLYRQYPPRYPLDVAPILDHIGKNTEAITEPFKVTPFRPNSWIPDKPIEVKRGQIASIKSYEEVALAEVDDFLKGNKPYENSSDPKERMTRYEQETAAEQALTAVYLGLRSDRERGRRRGGDWANIQDQLKKRLFAVQLEELKLLVRKGDWAPAFALTKRLAAAYTELDEQKKIAKPLADLILASLKQKPNEKQLAEASQRLQRLEELFPDNQALDDPTKLLREQARDKIAEANRLWEANGQKPSDNIARLVNEAEKVAPDEPAVRKFQLQMNHERPTLRVGVRELPSQMSPALARSDSDLRAVELMFESLVKLHPDGEGGSRWEPGLAEGAPRMIPRGRQFRLARDGRWSNSERITAVDVRETVTLLKTGKMASRPPVWGDLLASVGVGEASRVNLTLLQGWLDPLALMNFKVVPSGSAPSSPSFAAHPVGSGPFVYAENIKTDNGRPCVAFTANPYYSARPGKSGLPRIEEVHFIRYTDALDEMEHRGTDRCDLMLDLTAKEAAALQAKADVLDVREPPVAPVNRRIYFLAVNHRNPTLANAALRRALAYAVNRDALLDKYFRTTAGPKYHSPLNGPYPAKSWACNPDLIQNNGNNSTLDPFNIVKAKTSMAEAVKEGIRNPSLKLEYPKGDADLENAMKELCEQVQTRIHVTLTPVAVSPAELRNDVETTYSFELAYYHYDFPDDVYWLGPLLDPRGGPAGQNYMGYTGGGSGDLITLMHEISRGRDFPWVRESAHRLHDRFLNEEMPFIPLWQLDALSAVSNRVEIPHADLPFDPVRVFTDVERWRLK